MTGSGTLTFSPDRTSTDVPVPIRGEARDGPGETFVVNLSNPTTATITAGADGQGVATIGEDD